ncbi:glutamate N-acetyltransferase [Melghirimyces profundicolus]|uniref:Arginine biosynthesis bifunctional protein ArgJ n=1 Tax=Melghirimyces profundicolus TaxID=1242148 RepID=A0A2T6BUF3_9BACL|nr:bifunctional glutamate N-acetyltransferase/amino-acid acetyltransferase ArgJ [Melghirimyces profundicolus]PTX59684.1 glutamate N-acetyltransferase [Melghirimyces profundicolus]
MEQLQVRAVVTDGCKVAKEPRITSPRGFRAAGLHAGIKRKRKDLGMIVCEVPASAAAVYTMNAFQAAPLKVTREGLEVEGRMQAMIVNSGNANACTGRRGLDDARRMRQETARQLKIPEHLVGVVSTGVIGEPLPMDRMLRAIPGLVEQLAPEGQDSFCRSILTTDTFTKASEVRLTVQGKEVRVAGAAKGSGMVHPNMATMLAFINTDAAVEPPVLQRILRKVTDQTFNMITVDGDCSTNDMVTAMASGLAGNEPLTEDHPDWPAFCRAFAHVARDLARQIARDGEGATRLVEVTVTGAETEEGARRAAKAIVGSSLVKTAVFGADPNWGRIVCALGYSGAIFDPDRVEVYIGSICAVRDGRPVPMDEAAGRRELEQDPVRLRVNLNRGAAQATAWGCDLTYDYVRINASYRT